MNGTTRECSTDFNKESLDAAVGRRGNLGPHGILYELPHVDILNQKEKTTSPKTLRRYSV